MESVMYVHILPGFYSSLGPVGFWGEEVAKMAFFKPFCHTELKNCLQLNALLHLFL